MALSPGRLSRHAWISFAAAMVLAQPMGAAAETLDVRVASANDDAEESAAGAMSLSSSDLELGEDSGPQLVGLRWAGLAIPYGATIKHAWIQFTSKEAWAVATSVEIQTEEADDAAPFSSTAFDISSRVRTDLDVDWSPAPWPVGEAADPERTPDLQDIIQAVVSRPGWDAGHALAIIIHGTGHRTAWSWNGNAAAAPLLHVEFEGGGPPPPPPPPSGPIALYAGYYDTHHPENTRPKPDPWKGSPGVVFVGIADSGDGGWDSSCLRLDNITNGELDNVVVTVDIGAEHFALWGTRAIPANGTLIVAQTGFENFDGSDTNEAGCFSCSPTLCTTKVSNAVPVVTVKIGGTTTHYFDREQILNTRGVDAAGCPYTGGRSDESQPWKAIPSTEPNPVAGTPTLPVPTAVEFASPTPNPARGSVLFRFSMPVAGHVQLEICDVAGRLVRTCVDGWFESGTYLKGLDLTRITPGVYFGILRAPGGEAKRAFVVTR